MQALRIEVTMHWGFWTRSPDTSKFQSSFTIPPPTTLLGSLSADLIRRGAVNLNGEKVSGESWPFEGVISSPVAILEKAIPAATAYYEHGTRGFPHDDVSKLVTLHFHGKQLEEGILRRRRARYRTGALPVGKIYAPSGKLVICYLLNESELEVLLGAKWKTEILFSAYNIDRIGSKESIVSIDEVEPYDQLVPVREEIIETRFYFPMRHASPHELQGNYYTEYFWRGGWSREKSATFEQFLIPGQRSPIASETVRVKRVGGMAYRLAKAWETIVF